MKNKKEEYIVKTITNNSGKKIDVITHIIKEDGTSYPLLGINGGCVNSRLTGSFPYSGEYEGIDTDWVFNQKIEASAHGNRLIFSTEATRTDHENDGRNYLEFHLDGDTGNINIFKATDYNGSKYTTFETPIPINDGDLTTKKYVDDYIKEHGKDVEFKSGEPVKEISIVKTESETDNISLYSKEKIDGLLATLDTNINVIISEKVKALELPIGAIVVSLTAPLYGVWINRGLVENGQTIVGGETTNGDLQRHSHSYVPPTESVKRSCGTVTWKTGVSMSESSYVGKDDKNRAWGIGIGENKIVWERTE